MAAVKYLDKNGLSTVWSKVKGIVTPKADKVSGATNGHLAGLNSSGNLTDSGLVATNVAQKDGSYSGMTVGAAEDLVSAESVASEFTSRVTGGSTAVGKGGTALVDKIKGRTLVWNQKTNTIYYNPTVVTLDTSVTTEKKYNYISSTTSSRFIYGEGHDVPAGHKVLIQFVFKNGISSGIYFRFRNGSDAYENIYFSGIVQGEWAKVSVIRDNGFKFVNQSGFLASGDSVSGDYFSMPNNGGLSIFDLTLMFGAGNEPSTPEEFEALYPGPYYDYNPGMLISNAATAIETVGWNIWDEEWENCSWNSEGVKVNNVSCIGSSNIIPVLSDTMYYFSLGTIPRIIVKFFLVNGTVSAAIGWAPGQHKTPVGAVGMVFNTYAADAVTTYSHNICISLSDASRNGTYEPYWRSELELGLGDIKVKSHNLWDEEWEEGSYNPITGLKETTTSVLRATNKIRVLPITSYFIAAPSAGQTYLRFFYYTSESALIGVSNYLNGGATITTPEDCNYMTFVISKSAYGADAYQNNICINSSDPAYNGRYEPYGDGGVITLTGGLKSAGTVYDEISGGKLVKRIDEIDMGSKNWQLESDSTAPVSFFSMSISERKAGSAGLICPQYTTIDGHRGNLVDKALTTYNRSSSTKVCIADSDYSDAATFKAAMAGIHLYYELAQPIEYELADALPTAMRNDPYGTERRLPEDTLGLVTAPFRADITYSTNIKEAVQSLPQNYININSMQDFLAALGTQMGGTWTMRPADGKFDFTFTPNPETE